LVLVGLGGEQKTSPPAGGASARQPKDAVPGDETVRVPQYFINGTDVTRRDFGAGYKAVLGWRTVPAEAASVQLNKFWG
jgi:hypothetical protein